MTKSRFVLKQAAVGGGAASDLTRYVAKSKLDPEREGRAPRPLFTERADDLSFWEARKWLSFTGGAFERDDALHYVLSFERPEEYERLGGTDDERRAAVREFLRRALSRASEEIGVEGWRWAAGVHLNEPNPHVHILINKNALDRRTSDLVRVAKLPTTTVAHYRDDGGGGREFDYGTIIRSFAADVDARLCDRAREEDSVRQKKPDPERTRSRAGVWHDRLTLGEAMVARGEVERSEREVAALKAHGSKRHFLVFDATHGRARNVSDSDVRHRVEAETSRLLASRNQPASERERARAEFSGSRLSQHTQTLTEHEQKRQEHLAQAAERLARARDSHDSLRPRVAEIRERYERQGTPLPVPVLAPGQLRRLQDAAIEGRDSVRVRTLEKLRSHLAAERGEPPRSEHERGRLLAQQRDAETESRARTHRAAGFERTRHLTRWDVGGERWSLSGVDLAIEKARVKTSFVHVGIIAWLPSQKREAQAEMERLAEVRRQVEERIEERRTELESEASRIAETARVLTEMRDRGAPAGSHTPALPTLNPIHTRAELARMEVHARVLRDADLLREVNEAERAAQARLTPDKRRPVEELAARALGRAVLADLDLRERREAEAEHARRGRFIPVVARFADGSTVTSSPRQIEIRSQADFIIRVVEDNPDRRERDRAIRNAAEVRAAEIGADHKAVKEYAAAARDIAEGYRSELERAGKRMPEPVFTPAELNRIDLYLAWTTNAGERQRLQQLLDRSELPDGSHDRGERAFRIAPDDHNTPQQETKTRQPEPHVHIR